MSDAARGKERARATIPQLRRVAYWGLTPVMRSEHFRVKCWDREGGASGAGGFVGGRRRGNYSIKNGVQEEQRTSMAADDGEGRRL